MSLSACGSATAVSSSHASLTTSTDQKSVTKPSDKLLSVTEQKHTIRNFAIAHANHFPMEFIYRAELADPIVDTIQAKWLQLEMQNGLRDCKSDSLDAKTREDRRQNVWQIIEKDIKAAALAWTSLT